MKKTTLKLFLTFVLIITMFVSLVSSAYAGVIYTELVLPIENMQYVEQKINLYADTNVQYSIVGSKHLSGITNGYGYTLYELSPYGYVITIEDSDTILELCYEVNAEPPLPMNDDNTYYYVGPASFAVASEEGYTYVGTNIQLSKEDVDYIVSFENRFYSLRQDTQTINNLTITNTTVQVSQNVDYDYFSNLSNFGNNTEGTCTVIAISILLGYYDVFIYDGYIDDEYMDTSPLPAGTTEEFHQLLCNYVYGEDEHGGIQIYDAASAINEYLTEQGLSVRFSSPKRHNVSSTRQAIASLIDHGHPVVASINTAAGANVKHSVVVYGYVYETQADSNSASPNLIITADVPDDTMFRVHYGHPGNYNSLLTSAWFDVYGHITDCTGMGTHHYAIESTGNVDSNGSVPLYEKKRTCCSCGQVSYIWSTRP